MIITGDIGGTNARLEIFRDADSLRLGTYEFTKSYATGDITTQMDLIPRLLRDGGLSGKIELVVLGIPGNVVDNTVEPMNIPNWGIVTGEKIASSCGATQCILLNDFECAAYSAINLKDSDIMVVREGKCVPTGIKLMIGMGTGLGFSFICNGTPQGSEGGWMHFVEMDRTDHDLVEYLKTLYNISIVSFEQVCSGSAVPGIYSFFRQRRGLPFASLETKDICSLYEQDAASTDTLELMSEYLGRFISQMSLIFKPSGGVYLTGGFLDVLKPLLMQGVQFTRGLNMQSHPILCSIAQSSTISIICRDGVGLLGARCFTNKFLSNI